MPRRLTVDDVIRLAWFTELDASHDGRAAFVLRRDDVEANRARSELYVAERGRAQPLLVHGGPAARPRWGPGGLLAFTIAEEERGRRRSVVAVWPGAGEPRRLVSFEHGVRALEWLDAGRLVVVFAEPARGMHDEDYVATDRAPLWEDGEGLVAGLEYWVGLLDVWSGRLVKLAREELPPGSLAACRGMIYYSVPADWRDPLRERVVELAPDGSRAVLFEGYSVRQLRCVGGRLYALMHRCERGLATHYKLWLVEAGEPICVTCGSLDRNVVQIAGGLDGRPVVIYMDRGSAVLAEVDGGRVEDLAGRGMFVEMAAAGAGLVYFVASAPTEPPELYAYRRGGGVERVTGFNAWLAREVELARPERLEVVVDGERVEGWVMLPRGRGPHPLILYIHGGPKAMYGYRFYPEMQLMVASGFAVAYANPRGSDGYSEDFADVRGGYGEVDYRQLMAFLDEVVRRFPVDPSRLGVTGVSYGGYLTNVMVARAPERFRAAVSENGIADWVSDYWASDIGYWFDPDQIGGTPLDNLEEYVRRSPAYNLPERVPTAVMLIHSMEDYRCFVDQALAMHLALLRRGARSRLVVFRRGSHGHAVTAEPRHRRKRLELKLAWFREHLRPGG